MVEALTDKASKALEASFEDGFNTSKGLVVVTCRRRENEPFMLVECEVHFKNKTKDKLYEKALEKSPVARGMLRHGLEDNITEKMLGRGCQPGEWSVMIE